MPDSEFEALQAAVNAAQPLIQAEQQRRLERGREAQLCIICMSEPKAYAPRQCGHLSSKCNDGFSYLVNVSKEQIFRALWPSTTGRCAPF